MTELIHSRIEVPAPWKELQRSEDGVMAQHPSGLRVIVSDSIEEDGRRWRHLSVTAMRRTPHWHELKAVKEKWLGDDYAYTVFPPSDRYVNIHPNCLHLFQCLDEEEGKALPEFSGRIVEGKRTL